MSYAEENIWIIGASSGIGRTLAQELAKQGAHLILSARRKEALKALSANLKELAPNIETTILPCDVSQQEEVIKAFDSLKNVTVDRIIFMAAIYTPPGEIVDIDIKKARQIMDVNFMGSLIISQQAVKFFSKQRSGQLALCASVAGYVGLPRGQVYSATKAALINLAESLRAETSQNIDIKIINPGFVETPMTDDNDFEMPMIITPEEAASSIAKGLRLSGFEIHFPKKFTFIMKMIRLLPYKLSLALSRKMKP